MLNTFYKDHLSRSEQKTYDELYRGIALHRQDIQIPFHTGLAKILAAVNYDHPEFFYVNWLEAIQCVGYFGRMSVHLSMLYSETEIREINRRISELSKSIAGISNYGKALGVHDWFVKNVDYDHHGLGQTIRSPGIFSAAGPLLRKRAVCEGVSKLACLMMRHKGIDAAVITGCAEDGTLHAWNAFRSDNGNTMYVDITYDISNSPDKRNPCRKYFYMTKTEISKDHTFLNM